MKKLKLESKKLCNLTELELEQTNKIISQINISPIDKLKRKVYFLEKYYRIAYLLKIGKKLVAVALIKQDYIFNFAVLKTEQGNGYGEKLFKFILEDLKEQGYKKIKLGSNISYLNFWLKMGFSNKSYIVLERKI